MLVGSKLSIFGRFVDVSDSYIFRFWSFSIFYC
nr:MAG TPA: hypothetical protein [Bacteriophage sp.]